MSTSTPVYDSLVDRLGFHPTEVAGRHDHRLVKARGDQQRWLKRVLSSSVPNQRKARR